MTDDPLRAKMMIAHLLEQARPLYEQRGYFGCAGQFGNVSLSVLSCGFGQVAAELVLDEAVGLGVRKCIYLGECIALDPNLKLMETILVSGGNAELLGRAVKIAKELSIPARIETVLTNDRYWIEPVSTDTAIIDFASSGLYSLAESRKVSALCIAAVSENAATGARLEESVRQSRFNAAARLSFELAVRELHQ